MERILALSGEKGISIIDNEEFEIMDQIDYNGFRLDKDDKIIPFVNR